MITLPTSRRPLLIGIAGPIGSGKSTIAKQLAGILSEVADVKILPLAEPIRQMLLSMGVPRENLFGTQEQKDEPLELLCGNSVRHALQTLGTEWGRDSIGSDVWVNAWGNAASGYPVVICDDVRFPNEAEYFIHRGYCVLLRDRGICGAAASDHKSESHRVRHDFSVSNGADREPYDVAVEILKEIELAAQIQLS